MPFLIVMGLSLVAGAAGWKIMGDAVDDVKSSLLPSAPATTQAVQQVPWSWILIGAGAGYLVFKSLR